MAIKSVRCVNYRGFKDFTVEDLGQVNIVIGTNNCGKTSWIGAAVSEGRSHFPLLSALGSYGENFPVWNRDTHWRPLFRGGNDDQPLIIEVTHGDGQTQSHRLQVPDPSTTVGPDSWWYELVLDGPTTYQGRIRG